MHNPSETLTEIVRAQKSLELERQAELRATAHALIQAHVGWNRKVVSVERFYSAIVDALLQDSITRSGRLLGRSDYYGWLSKPQLERSPGPRLPRYGAIRLARWAIEPRAMIMVPILCTPGR